ncbi:MAG: hypothetical protein ACRBDI_05095 [Alphaproteobacteria bacterium]
MDNNFQSEMSDIDLMKSFIENSSTHIENAKNAFVEYGVYLPFGDNEKADLERINKLNQLIKEQGIDIAEFRMEQAYSNLSAAQIHQMEKGEAYGNMSINRAHYEKNMTPYLKKHDIDKLTLKEYAEHSGREVVMSMQYNMHAQDLKKVINNFRNEIANQRLTKEHNTLEV